MRISEPGTWTTDICTGSRCRGFTILEILVVVAIIAIILSTILLNTRFSRPETSLKQHAQTIGKTLRLLFEEATLEDVNYALWLQPGRYQVLQYDGESWQPVRDRLFARLARKHDYEDRLIVDGQPVPIEASEEPKPQILILASGDVSSFEWRILDRRNGLMVLLQGDALGQLSIEGPSVITETTESSL